MIGFAVEHGKIFLERWRDPQASWGRSPGKTFLSPSRRRRRPGNLYNKNQSQHLYSWVIL